MHCKLLDGKKVAHEWKCKLKSLIEFHMKEDPTVRTPKLVIFHNGNDDASKVYMKNKVKACTEVGINCEIIEVNHRVFQIPDSADGAILQLPVENDTIKDVFLKKVYHTNDADGLSIYSKGHLFNGTKYNIENFEDKLYIQTGKIKSVAQQMKNGIDTRKWICVEANDLLVAGYADMVMLIMVDSNNGMTARSFVDAFAAVVGAELEFVM